MHGIKQVFLTSDELKELTGFERASAQMRWLRQHCFPFEVGGDNVPKVLRSYVVSRFGGGAREVSNQRPRIRLP